MRTKINLILSALIALFSGCKIQAKIPAHKVVAIYGVPYATYEVKGTVIDKQANSVQGAKVVIKAGQHNLIGDTVITNQKGEFEVFDSAFPTNELNIVVHDPQSGLPIDSVQHKTKYKEDTNEQPFYSGKCTISTKIKIK